MLCPLFDGKNHPFGLFAQLFPSNVSKKEKLLQKDMGTAQLLQSAHPFCTFEKHHKTIVDSLKISKKQMMCRALICWFMVNNIIVVSV